MYFFRIILILLIIYLIARAFILVGSGGKAAGKTSNPKPEKDKTNTSRGVPKNIGEYVDYEEVNNPEG